MRAIGRLRRRSRTAFSTLLALVLGSQVVLAIIVDQGELSLRDPEYTRLEAVLRDRRDASPDLPLVLFVGSSRVAHGFDAHHAAGALPLEVFNFGMSGSGPFFQSVMLERLRAAGIRPDVLVLEVMHPFYNRAGPFSLDQGLLDGARLSAGEVRELMEYGQRSRSGPLKRYAHARALPAYRHSAEMRDSLGLCGKHYSPIEPMDAWGFRSKDVPAVEQAELTRIAHANYDEFYRDFETNPQVFARLRSMVEKSQSLGTKVVLLLMPEGSSFRSEPANEIEAKRLRLFERMHKELGVRLVDARDWLRDEAFYDQHHLRPDGASRFADRFREEVLLTEQVLFP